MYDQRRSAAAAATQRQQQRQKTIMVGRAASSSSTAATSLAILGLSVTFLRWWNANSNNNKHDHPLSAFFPASGGGGERLKSVTSWWPIIAIQRWMERSSRINSTTIAGDEEYYSNNEEHNDAVVVEVVNHQGSCHCGSIKFQLHGPRKLRAIDYSSSSSSSPPIRKNRRRRPVCFFSTSIPISANKFQLITGQDSMRFYYEDDNNNDATTAFNDNYSSSITSDHHTTLNNISNSSNNNNNQALGAHSFCTNCGVHVFYADRNSGRLEVNANCIIGQVVGDDDGERVSITTTKSAVAALAATAATTTMKTPIVNNKTGLSHKNNEPLLALAGASFIESLEYDNSNNKNNNNSNNDLSNTGQCYSSSSNINKELSVTSTTDPESSYSTAVMMDGDDTSSMGSQSATSAYLSLYHTSQHGVLASPLATSHDRTTTSAMMGAGPRIPSSNRSVKTLPPRLGGGGIGSGWSVTSSDDLLFNMDDDDEEQTTVSPKMRDRMMKYLKRHIDPIQEDK